MKTTLTKNELRVRNITMIATYDVIEAHLRDHGCLPSLSKMAELVQIKMDHDYAEAQHLMELDQVVKTTGLAIIALCESRAKNRHKPE